MNLKKNKRRLKIFWGRFKIFWGRFCILTQDEKYKNKQIY